jgi:hypothetical protein
MKLPLALGLVLGVAGSFAATNDYTIRILRPDPLAAVSRLEYQAAKNLVGKSIAEIFGPVSEVRMELDGSNTTGIDRDTKQVEQRIRWRIDSATCRGRDSDVAWHKAPWARGYILLKDGRVLPMQILLSGIIVGDLLFAEGAEPSGAANGASPTQQADARRGALTEREVRRLAADFKQKWMAEHPAEIEQIGQATIREVKKTATGWHVVFEQIRFPGEPEGESHHFLHIYLDSNGTLEKIVRGPDVIT